MATFKMLKREAKCRIHDTPVKITIPADRFGNAHGEEWFCEECKGSPENILVKF